MTSASPRIVYFNGRFVPEREARVSIYDAGLLMGDIAYEVTRTIRHEPFRLDEHLERLFASLDAMRIDAGLARGELRDATLGVLARNLPTEADDVDWNIIHNVSRGPSTAFAEAFDPAEMRPTVIVSCYPLLRKVAELAPAYERGIDCVVPRQRSLPGEMLPAWIKARSRLHYQLANLEASEMRPGAWAVMTDPAGHITEGTSGNVFVVRDGELLTPRDENLLPGITRQLILDLAAADGQPGRECDLDVHAAASADEMFLTSTTIGVLHVRTFDGRPIGDGRAGPRTQRLRKQLFDAVGLDFAAQAQSYARRLAK